MIDVTPEERLVFNYWITVISLLKIGIPYNTILELSSQEMKMLIGVQNALTEHEQEELERQQRVAEQKSRGRR